MYKQYEKDETIALQLLVSTMNNLHAKMGGRSNRPERKALEKAMHVLNKEIERYRRETLNVIA